LKDAGCWYQGMFFFTPLYFEVEGIRMEVEDLEDGNLVEEVSLILLADDYIDKILYTYAIHGILDPESRESLINFYVLYTIQDYLMIMEEEEI